MEEGVGNGWGSGVVIKNRTSAGCLIVKKKGDGYSGADVVYRRKERKRPRLVDSEEESTDDELFDFYRKQAGIDQVRRSSPLVYEKRIAKDSEFSRKRDVNFGRNEVIPGERKRNALDAYYSNEYDDLDDVELGHFDGAEAQGTGRMFSGARLAICSGPRRDFGTGSSRHAAVSDRGGSFVESSSGRKLWVDSSFLSGRFDGKSKLPIPVLEENFGSPFDEAIRLQGKNGVLKVMVKHKKVGGVSAVQNAKEVVRSSMSAPRELAPTKMISSSVYLEKNVLHDPIKSYQTHNGKMKSRKLAQSDSSIDSDEQSEGELPEMPSSDAKTCRPTRRRKKESGVTPLPEKEQASRLKENKVKRGSGTEKQLLREQIRSMLVNAGWTIDYRPRKNRDYFDAVYINPAGTAYWSIIKAYDAFQKQNKEGGAKVGADCSPFNPISDEVLSKLTRQTQKKLEKELKKKKREENAFKRKKNDISGKFVNEEHETDSTSSSSEEEIPLSNKLASH